MMGGAKTLGIIAGGGRIPAVAAKNARAQGFRVVVAAIEESSGAIPRACADVIERISLARAGDMLGLFQREDVTEALFIGKVDKRLNFTNLDFDETALAMLARLAGRGDMQIASLVIEELENRGFRVRAQTDFLGDLLAPAGVIAGSVSEQASRDIARGLDAARALAAFDVGQTVVVREGAVIAVEAFEHTDATIRRAGRLAKGNLVVVKVARPNQDLRFDVPTVGPATLRVMAKAGATTLAVEAGKALVMDRKRFVRYAEHKGMAVIGVKTS